MMDVCVVACYVVHNCVKASHLIVNFRTAIYIQCSDQLSHMALDFITVIWPYNIVRNFAMCSYFLLVKTVNNVSTNSPWSNMYVKYVVTVSHCTEQHLGL